MTDVRINFLLTDTKLWYKYKKITHSTYHTQCKYMFTEFYLLLVTCFNIVLITLFDCNFFFFPKKIFIGKDHIYSIKKVKQNRVARGTVYYINSECLINTK